MQKMMEEGKFKCDDMLTWLVGNKGRQVLRNDLSGSLRTGDTMLLQNHVSGTRIQILAVRVTG